MPDGAGPCPAIAALTYPEKRLHGSVEPPPLVAVNVLLPLSLIGRTERGTHH